MDGDDESLEWRRIRRDIMRAWFDSHVVTLCLLQFSSMWSTRHRIKLVKIHKTSKQGRNATRQQLN